MAVKIWVHAMVAAVMVAAVCGASSAEELTATRRAMLGSIAPTRSGAYEDRPNADGDYIYEATSARPSVEGGSFQIESDRLVEGLTLVRAQGGWNNTPDGVTNPGVYWRLGDIRPGSYWIGVVYESQDWHRGVEAAENAQPGVILYLNGRIVQSAGHSDPVQLAPGIWFVESHSRSAEALQPGDEITAFTYRGGRMARLVLRSRAPEIGPHRMAANFGGFARNPYTALVVNVDAWFVDRDGRRVEGADPHTSIEQRAASVAAVTDDEGRTRVVFQLANPLPIPLTVAFEGTVRSYYREELVRLEESIELAPHAVVRREATFAWQADEPAQTAEAILRAVNPPAWSAPRSEGGLGWPELETVEYFPFHRHVIAWPDPYSFRVVRRVTLAHAADGFRDRIVLDAPAGDRVWQRALTPLFDLPMPLPDDLVFEPTAIPQRWHGTRTAFMRPQPHTMVNRRSFVLPDDLGDRSYRLVIESFVDEGTAYVNGVRVGQMRGQATPLECDITRAARPGTNELVVVVRDLLAIMNPEYVDLENPVLTQSYLDAPGLFSMTGMAMGSTVIEVAPSVSAEDVFVIPSVRRQTLGARIAAANRGIAPVRAHLKAEVLDGGHPVLLLGEREVMLSVDAVETLALETPWADARLWGPTDPHLYVLAVTLTDADTGRVLDFRRERFGFRESWVEGAEIMFNGRPMRPVGRQPITRLQVGGNQLIARSAGNRADYFSEIGQLSAQGISGLQNQPSQHNVERDAFWEAVESNALIKLRHYQNYPCIIAWELSNEWLWYLQYSVDDIMAGARRFKHFSDTVRAYDPTRWTRASAEGDAFGLLDNMDFHYMYPYFETSGYGMRGVSEYFPDSQFWRTLDRHIAPGEEIPLNPFSAHITLRPDEKPILDTEFLWKTGSLMTPTPTRVSGEDNLLSPAVDSGAGAIAWMYKTMIDGHRDLGVIFTHIHNTFLAGVVRGGYLPQTAIIPENQRNAFGGRPQTRRFTLINSLFDPAEFVLRWTLTGPDGQVTDRGEQQRRMDAGELHRGNFAFTPPVVSHRTTYTLAALLDADGRTVSGEEWDIEVFPDEPVMAGALARKVVLFEPGVGRRGSGVGNPEPRTLNPSSPAMPTAAALAAAGVPFERVTDLAAFDTRPPPPDTLIILAENALTAENAPHTAALGDWVEAGGRVLVLRQSVSPANLPVKTILEPRQWASQVFVRLGEHPVMQGLTDMDLHFWQPDRAVGLGAYSKPPSGACVTLADSGGGRGMEWTHLAELYRGKGFYLLCQLPVAGRYDEEPMARELLARLVRSAGGEEAYASPTAALTVVAEASSPILARLNDLGADLSGQLAVGGGYPILVEAAAGRDLPNEERKALGEALRAGATVVVAGATPEDADWLSEWVGVPVSVSVTPYRMWDGRGYRRDWSRWTAGLSHQDLYWKRLSSEPRTGEQAHESSYMIEPLQDYAVHIAGGLERVFPGALAEIVVGQGQLLLDQRRWWTSHPNLVTQASRNLSALLTGLNVSIAPTPPPPELPAGVVYRPIDLSPFANRGLIDEVAEDGKGGWSDQGPRADLRSFPTGRQLFKGVPFHIGEEPTVCIVLAARRRPGFDDMPREVSIPVGMRAEGLFFLHSVAYSGAGAHVGSYDIAYEDGEVEEIKLIGGMNIHDWNGAHTFLREVGTQSVNAWTGRNETFPLVSVYRMMWVNPRPDVPVKSVRFHNPRLRNVPILVGLTVAEKGGAASDDDATRAAALLAQAREAATANRVEEAWRLYGETTAANPSLADAHAARLALAERLRDEDRILEAAWSWGLSGLPAYVAWARFGELQEKRGDFRGALEAYRKSLEIEWNQPPVMDAAKRLESREQP